VAHVNLSLVQNLGEVDFKTDAKAAYDIQSGHS
jgi:hypothetical protein